MTKFETLMQQLIDMAASGEISNDEIKNVYNRRIEELSQTININIRLNY